MIWDHEIVIGNLFVQVFVIFAAVWEATAEECEQEHSRGIDVSGWAAELNLFYDLWCHVRWCPAEQLDFLCVGYLSTETKIY